MFKKILLLLTAVGAITTMVNAQKTEVSIKGESFYINGRPTYEGRYWNEKKVEGLLMNSRMVQGVFDNIGENKEANKRFAYSDTNEWSAERNTKEFVEAMSEWHSYGLLAFTVNLQGGSPMGYGGNVGFVNSAFNRDGSMREDYKKRLKLIIERADELGMVVILGYFYQGQDENLENEKAVYRAVKEATEWVLESGYLNVMVEIANECDVKSYDHDIIKVANNHKLIEYAKSITRDGRRLLVSTSLKGCSIPTEEIVATSDYVLIHGNGMKKPDQMIKALKNTRALKNYTPKPIVVNEDDNYNFESQFCNINLAVENYASWGMFDYRREGDNPADGFQSVPVDWRVNTYRKKQFFERVKEITNFGGEPEAYDNPILPGYHPDPTICRKGEDYYLVNSSFEWYPGIPLYHSRDLVNWKLIGYGGTKENKFDLAKNTINSGGIYAATIRYNEKEDLFYIITTNTGRKDDPAVKGNGNFYITAKDPAGVWSEPIYLDCPGIDPSLFWDEDGRCYYIGQGNLLKKSEWKGQHGVWLQELDTKKGELIGERKQLTFGHATNAHAAEGPHLYKIGKKYIIILAEGGTYRSHAATAFESENIWGPYVPTIINPIISHRQLGPTHPISSIGHADIIQTQNGDWWIVTLGRRHFNGYVYLARETFLSPVTMYESSLFTNHAAIIINEGEGKMPEVAIRPNLKWSPFEKEPIRDNFEGDTLSLEWNMLRTPENVWHKLSKGNLELDLRAEVLTDFVQPSLLAKRISHHSFRASTRVSFSTKKSNEEAGITLYRNTKGYITMVKNDKEIIIRYATKEGDKEACRIPCTAKEVILAMESNGKDVTFEWGEVDKPFVKIDATVPLHVISDDNIGGYNGPMIGVYATSNGVKSRNKAIFRWFDYSDK